MSIDELKIEITPEMIEAGAEAIAERYGRLDLSPLPSVVAQEVVAMLAIAHSRRHGKRP